MCVNDGMRNVPLSHIKMHSTDGRLIVCELMTRYAEKMGKKKDVPRGRSAGVNSHVVTKYFVHGSISDTRNLVSDVSGRLR